MLLAYCTAFSFLHAIHMASFLVACLLDGNWTCCWVACKVASYNPHLRHTTCGSTPLSKGSAFWKGLYLTTHNTHNRHPCHRWNQNHNHSKPAAADPHLSLCSYLDQPFWHLVDTKYSLGLSFAVPLCNSLKCLFVSCVWKSKCSIWERD